jgi:hypothetical protein
MSKSNQPKPPVTSPPKPADPAAAEFAQSLLTQMQRDFVTAPKTAAAEKANAATAAQALLGQMHQDFVTKDREKKAAAAHLATALLNKVTRDFGTIPPPSQAQAASVTTESDAELQAAGNVQSSSLSAEDLAELDAMVAPTGFWGKLIDRMRGKKT